LFAADAGGPPNRQDPLGALPQATYGRAGEVEIAEIERGDCHGKLSAGQHPEVVVGFAELVQSASHPLQGRGFLGRSPRVVSRRPRVRSSKRAHSDDRWLVAGDRGQLLLCQVSCDTKPAKRNTQRLDHGGSLRAIPGGSVLR
jgi:hypothetical protein